MNVDPAYIGFIAAFCTTFSFVPQAWQVIKTRETKAISLPGYILFWVGIFCWLIYGVLLGDYPLIIANVITLSFVSIILALKIKYG
jgi:MtN3 and saliva related transmembrane protein